jgi:hypothetical protein
MIGKIIIGTNFGPALTYVLAARKQDLELLKNTGLQKAVVLKYNNCFGNKNELIDQFNEVKMLNHKVSRAVLHLILSFDSQDNVRDSQMVEIVAKLEKKMGFDKHQYVAVSHNDTDHRHIHLIINRISLERKTLKDSNDYKVVAEFSRQIELEYGFRQVLSPRRFLTKEDREKPRMDKRIEAFKELIRLEVIPKSKNWDDFQYNLIAKGATMIKGRGLLFVDEKGVRIKASKIGLSILQIENSFSATKVNSSNELNSNLEARVAVVNATSTQTIGAVDVSKIYIEDQDVHLDGINASEIKPMHTQPREHREKLRMDQRIKAFKELIRFEILPKSRNWDEFRYNLSEKGATMIKGRGLLFVDEQGVRIKASNLGLSIFHIEELFSTMAGNSRKELNSKLESSLSILNVSSKQKINAVDGSRNFGEDQNAHLLRIIMAKIKTSKTWPELDLKLIRHGISLKRERGLTIVVKDSSRIIGSEVGLSISNIETRFLHNSNIDDQEEIKTKNKIKL